MPECRWCQRTFKVKALDMFGYCYDQPCRLSRKRATYTPLVRWFKVANRLQQSAERLECRNWAKVLGPMDEDRAGWERRLDDIMRTIRTRREAGRAMREYAIYVHNGIWPTRRMEPGPVLL